MTAASKVRRWRERAGLSQEQAARIIGVSRSTFQHVELGGHRNLTMSTMEKLMMQVRSLNLSDFAQ